MMQALVESFCADAASKLPRAGFQLGPDMKSDLIPFSRQ